MGNNYIEDYENKIAELEHNIKVYKEAIEILKDRNDKLQIKANVSADIMTECFGLTPDEIKQAIKDYRNKVKQKQNEIKVAAVINKNRFSTPLSLAPMAKLESGFSNEIQDFQQSFNFGNPKTDKEENKTMTIKMSDYKNKTNKNSLF